MKIRLDWIIAFSMGVGMFSPLMRPMLMPVRAANQGDIPALPDGDVSEIMMLPAARKVLIGQTRGQVSLLDLDTQKLLKTRLLHGFKILRMFLVDEAVWVVFNDRQVWQIDRELKPLRKFRLAGEFPLISAVCSDHQLLLADINGLWQMDLTTGQAQQFKLAPLDFSVRLALSERGILAASLRTGQIALIDLGHKKLLRILSDQTHRDDITAMAFNPGSEYLVSADEEYALKVWNVDSGELLAKKYSDSFLQQQRFISANEFVTADIDGNLYFLKTPSLDGDMIAKRFSGWPSAIRLDPENRRLWIGLTDPSGQERKFLQILSLQRLQNQLDKHEPVD